MEKLVIYQNKYTLKTTECCITLNYMTELIAIQTGDSI